jgi:hypothetical protein
VMLNNLHGWWLPPRLIYVLARRPIHSDAIQTRTGS